MGNNLQSQRRYCRESKGFCTIDYGCPKSSKYTVTWLEPISTSRLFSLREDSAGKHGKPRSGFHPSHPRWKSHSISTFQQLRLAEGKCKAQNGLHFSSARRFSLLIPKTNHSRLSFSERQLAVP